jgi:hypothetical protein
LLKQLHYKVDPIICQNRCSEAIDATAETLSFLLQQEQHHRKFLNWQNLGNRVIQLAVYLKWTFLLEIPDHNQ